jgi:plastocyanin
MKKLLGLVSVLMLVGAGCSMMPPAQPPSGKLPITNVNERVGNPAVGATTVTVNADGTFSPATVTIKAGGTVAWLNHSATPVWVASDPHPTHGGYPGFDSDAAIDVDKAYTFKFDKKGTWGYHNHLTPKMKGTVIVE